MADSEQHRAKLQQLNRNFVRSVEEADVAWFDANLAADFLNTNPDGSLIGSGPLTLQPGAKTSRLLREVIPQTQTRASDGGFLFVQSDVPVFGIELFFSRNLQILSNVAAGSGINFEHP